jgi:hypothetical protein
MIVLAFRSGVYGHRERTGQGAGGGERGGEGGTGAGGEYIA